MRETDYFLTKARSSKSELDWSKYRNLRNTVTREIRKAKGRYYRNLLEENLDNPGKFWQAIKKLVPNEKSSTKTSTIRIKHDDKLTEDNYTTANAFCNFCCNLAKQMNNNLIDCSYTLNNIIHHARSVNVFNFTPVLPSSILCYLKSIKVCKSSGIDTIPAKSLRDAASEISVSLTGLINLSLSLGNIPDEWKVAKGDTYLQVRNA